MIEQQISDDLGRLSMQCGAHVAVAEELLDEDGSPFKRKRRPGGKHQRPLRMVRVLRLLRIWASDVTLMPMDTTRPTRHHPVLLAPEDVEAAGASARLLHRALEPTPAGPDSVRLLMEEPVEQQIVLPAAAARLLAEMLAELANGNAVSVVPLQAELTTQQAADLLGVSRPYLIGLLEQGRIEHRRVGNRRRVPVADLLRFQHEENERTRAAVAALTEQAEELGLGYEG